MTQTTYYRRRALISDCDTAYTATVTITVRDKPTFNTTVNEACYGKSTGSITVTGTFKEYSKDNGSNWQEASTFSGLSKGTYYIKVKTSDGCISDAATIAVDEFSDLTAGGISSNQTICNGSTPSALTSTSAASGGSGSYIYQWQKSSNGTSGWTDIGSPSSTAGGYSPSPMTQTTYYRRRALISNCDTAYTTTVTITVKPHAIAGNITIAGDTVICSGMQTTLNASNNINISSAVYKWYKTQTDPDPFYTGSSYMTSALTTPDSTFYVSVSGDDYCENMQGNRKKVVIKASHPMDYPDIRVRICPKVGHSVNLSKYIDPANLAETDLNWSGNMIQPNGYIITNNFTMSRIFTVTYTIANICAGTQTRKAYVEVLENGRTPLLRDTVLPICYDLADAIQINQIFGIEADGDWIYYAENENDLNNKTHITVSTLPPCLGSIVMKGKAVYDDPSISKYPYLGDPNAKKVVFLYKTDDASCLNGKEYKIIIVIYKN
jgi:hypothetical protein